MTFDDEITAALRRDLQAAHVGFDAAGAETMIRVATQPDPLGERRAYAAPLAAAAAVVVIGGGVATFAATRGGDTATGGGSPNRPAVCGSISDAPAESPSAPGSAPGSALPPIYTTPETPPSPVRTTPDSTAPGMARPSRTSEPSTSPAIPIGPLLTLPASGAVTVTLPPVNTTPAVPSATVEPTAAPTLIPSSSATDEPCTPNRPPSATARDVPTPVPTTGYIECSARDIDPGFSGCITFRVTVDATAGKTTTQAVPMADVPHNFPYVLKTYVIDNPNGDTGTVLLRLSGRTLITRELGPRTGAVTVVEPAASAEFSRNDPVEVTVTCTNSQRACTPAVTIGARPVQSNTPSATASASHS